MTITASINNTQAVSYLKLFMKNLMLWEFKFIIEELAFSARVFMKKLLKRSNNFVLIKRKNKY
jgi:hypothetical protein